MNYKRIILGICFTGMTVQLFGQITNVNIKGTTYGLDRSPSCLKNPGCLRGAANVGGAAVVAATARVEETSKEVKNVEKKTGDHVQAVVDVINEAEKVSDQLSGLYVTRIGPYNKEASEQNQANADAVAAIDAFNGLQPEQQSQGEADRLNRELQRTLDWGERLRRDSVNIVGELIPVLEKKDMLARKRQELIEENKRLEIELRRKKFEEGEAYRQLKMCAEYAKEINELIGKMGNLGIDLIELNSADETLKNLSNKMFGEGNNHTGSYPVIPGYGSAHDVSFSTEPYQVRAQRLIDALPPQQKAVVAVVGKQKQPKTEVPSPAVNKSTSGGVIQRFLNWVKQ